MLRAGRKPIGPCPHLGNHLWALKCKPIQELSGKLSGCLTPDTRMISLRVVIGNRPADHVNGQYKWDCALPHGRIGSDAFLMKDELIVTLRSFFRARNDGESNPIDESSIKIAYQPFPPRSLQILLVILS